MVVEYLDKKYGKPGRSLLPEDAGEHGMVCRLWQLCLDPLHAVSDDMGWCVKLFAQGSVLSCMTS